MYSPAVALSASGCVELEECCTQELMKSWRRGFIRCRSREGPCGSHHEAASREKCDTSVSETEDVGEGVARCGRGAAVENGLRRFELDGDVDIDAGCFAKVGAALGRSRAASRRRLTPQAGLVIDMSRVVRNRGSSQCSRPCDKVPQ